MRWPGRAAFLLGGQQPTAARSADSDSSLAHACINSKCAAGLRPVGEATWVVPDLHLQHQPAPGPHLHLQHHRLQRVLYPKVRHLLAAARDPARWRGRKAGGQEAVRG